jgi:hypothetical protein
MRPARVLRRLFASLAVLAALATGGCVDGGVDRVLDIEATGALSGLVFLDRNGNLTQDSGEGPVQGIAVQIIQAGTRTVVARLVSTLQGSVVASNLPVGDYEVVIEPATVPDSLRLIRVAVGNSPLTVPTVRLVATDTTDVSVVLSFPAITVRQARATAPSRRVFIEGVALNAWTTYGDSTLHVADTSGVIRTTRVAQSAVAVGQLVRVLGTTEVRDGQAILTDVTAFPVGTGQVPAPRSLTTLVASRADDGRADAALVQVSNATILSGQSNVAGDFILTVTDGSGLLDVVLDRESGISSSPYLPGAALNAVGLLVPSGQLSRWVLKPRSGLDLTISFPTATVADARRLPAGRVVAVEGVALNAWATFADSSVHVNDATGTIRAVNVQPANILPGQRVRMLGTIVFRDGQPTLANASPQILGTGVLPLAERLTSARASTADGARLDAALVRVIDALVSDTLTINGDLRLTVDDGSGPLEVLLDRDAGLQLGVQPGAILDVTGVLIPITGGASWRLKPRGPTDFVTVGSAKATVAQARSLPVGRVVLIEGVALNDWAMFADSTVHVADDTGSIRMVAVRPSSIVASQRVRMLGTIGRRDGQPVLSNVTPAVIGAGIMPLAPNLQTVVAATADGGRLDAALVRISLATVSQNTTLGADYLLRVSDGSGTVEVLLDRDGGFQPAAYPANVRMNVTGVLVPTGSGMWRLKPRSPSDIVILP